MPNEIVQTQDGITGQLATETDLASYDFAEQQLNGMQTPTFGNFSQDPNVKEPLNNPQIPHHATEFF